MPRKGYEWEIGNTPPVIEAHSLTKHEVIREYLSNYIQILSQRPVVESLNLTLVDGFAGGGMYTHYQSGEEIPGSPLILIKTIEESEALINLSRQEQGIRNSLKINANYLFIEKDKENYNFLDAVIRSAEINPKSRKRIKLINGAFSEHLLKTIEFAQNQKNKQRCIFLLDQYGYSDVPFTDIRKIFEHFQTAEVILTFGIGALVNYICEDNQQQYLKKFSELGLSQDLDINELIETKETTSEWRFIIESQLINAIKHQSGAKHFTPFFIVSRKSNRAYWLVHLSMHPRAQDEMTRLHWKFNTYFQHYGKPGMNMLGYDPSQDASLKDQLSLNFMFDSNAKQLTHESLLKEIPQSIHEYENGVSYEQYFASTCNDTPADDNIYRDVLNSLLQDKEIEIIGRNGEIRRSGNSIKKTDIISLPRQKKLIFI